MDFKAEALRNLEAARPVTPEALLFRAQTCAFLHLAERIDHLIETVAPKGMTREQMRDALNRWKEQNPEHGDELE